eukprot:203466-Amphidinium_carterae.2
MRAHFFVKLGACWECSLLALLLALEVHGCKFAHNREELRTRKAKAELVKDAPAGSEEFDTNQTFVELKGENESGSIAMKRSFHRTTG